MTRVNTIVAACIFLFGPLCYVLADTSEEPSAHRVSYQRDIRPIFQTHCQGCHQPAKSMGDYVMTNHQSLMQSGESGDAAIVPGKPDQSYLVRQITPKDGTAEMPKKGKRGIYTTRV